MTRFAPHIGLCRVLAAAAALSSIAGAANAKEWTWLSGMTSAKLAAAGWTATASAGLSWPDGRQAVVTHWRAVIDGHELAFRCIDYFDENMRPAGETCAQPTGPD
jgi:hypothetical protein